jgi:hypothetical protein
MHEREIAEKNKILEIVTGSFLYGTNMPESDKDYVGVFMPDIEYVLGFRRCEEVDFSITDKTAEGKNTKNALDRKLYEFRKFVKLAMENNPNIIEILFVNDQNCTFVSPDGADLLNIRELFPHKGLKQKFLGYAFAQKHKMVIKKDNYFDLINAFDYIQRFDIGRTILEIALDNDCPSFFKKNYNIEHNVNFIQVGDVNFNPGHTVKTLKKKLQDRINKVGNREELLTKYGYDVKFGSHLIRLMLEGVELLTTGKLEFPLKDREMLKDIRNGNWTVSRILEYSNELEKEIESLAISSKLPAHPRVEELERFTINKLKAIVQQGGLCDKG